jgi:hypothetical protein
MAPLARFLTQMGIKKINHETFIDLKFPLSSELTKALFGWPEMSCASMSKRQKQDN